jgi:hypothetical protein
MKRVYLTGNTTPEQLIELASELERKGYKVSTFIDVVADDLSEDQNLRQRLTEVLECDQLVTASELTGNINDATTREVNLARLANIPVNPIAKLLRPTTTA